MKLFLAYILLMLASIAAADFDPNNLADDDLWNKLACKGGKLMAMATDDSAPQSKFEGDQKESFATWGYKDGTPGYVTGDLKGYWKQETACKALGIDSRPKMWGGANVCYKIEHYDSGSSTPKREQKYKVKDTEYRSTGADLEIAVNVASGVVFQQYVTSPKTAARNLWNKEPAPEELPELRSLSDLMWGLWNRDNPTISNIHYFWVQGVGNLRTKAAIARALKGVNKGLEKWPGTTFGMDEEAGLAILGSENAACFGFFLGQHKNQLGNKVIEKVQVFMNDGKQDNVDPDLIFYVKDTTQSHKRRWISARKITDSHAGLAKGPSGDMPIVVEVREIGAM